MINIFTKCSREKCLTVDVNKPDYKCRGFSLVEVCLAMLVLSIGVLSVLSLFVTGLDQSVRSINNTKAAFFADEVFNGLLAESERDWSAIGVTNGITNLIIAAGSVDAAWDNSGTLDVVMDNKIHTNIYRLSDDPNIVNHSFRYSLGIERKDRYVKSATLFVYPEEYGGTNDPSVFHMNIFNYQLQYP